jgi:hypothetical protein
VAASFLTEENRCAKFPPAFALGPVPEGQVMEERFRLDEEGLAPAAQGDGLFRQISCGGSTWRNSLPIFG